MKFIILFLLSFSLRAETLRLVTGEYAPYTGEHLEKGGISTQIIEAIFKNAGIPTKITFAPWNRAMAYLKSGAMDGSFSWVKSPEREEEFYYSDPIHTYRVVVYVKKGSLFFQKKDFRGKKICHPDGWTISPYQSTIEEFKMKVDRPISIESCFRMLNLGRVDLIALNEYVGLNVRKDLYGNNPAPFDVFNTGPLTRSGNLFFIAPKKAPESKKLIETFNANLKQIKDKGLYNKIVKLEGKTP